MSGRLEKRCGCRDGDGRQLGRKCPLLPRSSHGGWTFVMDVPGEGGRRRQIRRSGFATRGEAQAELDKIRARQRAGQDVGGRRTVSQELDDFLAGKRAIRPTTRRAYTDHVERIWKPRLGHVQLERLRTAHIAQAIADLEADLAKDGRSLAPSSLLRILATLRSALGSAVRQGRLPANPAAFVELPERVKPRVQPWSPTEVGRFLDVASSHRLSALFEVGALSGLRRGELCGLRWADVDLEHRVLTVTQQVVDVGGRLVFGPPKTSSGEHRKVDIDEATCGALLAHRLHQDAERAAAGPAWVPNLDLVFCREDGSPLRPEYASRLFAALTGKAKVRQIRFHDLRHGSASLQLAAGVPLAIVSKRLGHSTVTITADLYSHLLEGVGAEAAEATAAIVPRASRDHIGDHLADSEAQPTGLGEADGGVPAGQSPGARGAA